MWIYIYNCINLSTIINFSNSSSSGRESHLLQWDFHHHSFHMWNSNRLYPFQKSFPYCWEKRVNPTTNLFMCFFFHRPQMEAVPCWGSPCPGQASCIGRWQALSPLICAASQPRSAPAVALLFQHEVKQISLNLQNYLFALQQAAEKRNARLVRHWSQWGNNSLLFPLNAKVHLIYLERCGVLQRYSSFRQPEMWAATESNSPTPFFVLEVICSLL